MRVSFEPEWVDILRQSHLDSPIVAEFVHALQPSQRDAFTYLLRQCVTVGCLTTVTLELLMINQQFEAWESCLNEINHAYPLSAKMLTFLLSAMRLETDLTGVPRAFELMQWSRFYDAAYAEYFRVLAQVLANPLSQTIYDARLRTFSDYASPIGPLDQSLANHIIEQLQPLYAAQRYRAFFDFFAHLRPLPYSQRGMFEVDFSLYVTNTLERYCRNQIASMQHHEDYHKTYAMIKKLRRTGGDMAIFDDIKYQVASDIESEDHHSSRTYDTLMQSIFQALAQPQRDLSDFTPVLQASTAYRRMSGAAMVTRSFHAPTPAVEAPEAVYFPGHGV